MFVRGHFVYGRAGERVGGLGRVGTERKKETGSFTTCMKARRRGKGSEGVYRMYRMRLLEDQEAQEGFGGCVLYCGQRRPGPSISTTISFKVSLSASCRNVGSPGAQKSGLACESCQNNSFMKITQVQLKSYTKHKSFKNPQSQAILYCSPGPHCNPLLQIRLSGQSAG